MAHDQLAKLPALVEEAEVSELADEALTWCSLNGLVVGDAQAEGTGGGSRAGLGLVHAPVTLSPCPFPSLAFFQAYSLAPLLNDLVDSISQDREFLVSTLSSAAKTDPFTASLLDIYSRTKDEDDYKRVRLGMHRSDYMLDVGTNNFSKSENDKTSVEDLGKSTLLQVELNTIASSFPGLSSQVSSLHRHLVEQGLVTREQRDEWRIPNNPAADVMAQALALAWRAQQSPPEAVVLMVVQPGERNLYDQRWLLQKLWKNHGIKSMKRTLAQVAEQGELRGPKGELWIGDQRVSVVYYRAGYGPDDYPSEKEWQARLLMERSSAVSCPNISYHLAGAKKIQQKLAEEGVLERFVRDEGQAREIRACFAGLWSLEPRQSGGSEEESDNGSASLLESLPGAVRVALEDPERFVLKPQREGGGNNIYGQDVRTKIQDLLASADPSASLAAFVLMQRIRPPVNSTLMMRRGEASWVDSLSELGVYGVYVRCGNSVLLNKAAGHLLRTKTASSDEGGVATGYAVLDSPYLI